MSLQFIKQYAPNLSADVERHAHQTSQDNVMNYAETTKNTDHIHKMLDREEPHVRMNAALNKNASKENIDKALDDRRWEVRLAAQMNPRYREYYPKGH